ncbi:DedA family protein [Swingsia samuiensis]|nr:VTT domain-containing protein [Swingsia samuiensis]
MAAQPMWLKSAIIIISTFILEDVATVLSAIAAHSGYISFFVALCSLWAGIALGDIGLYGLGNAAARWPYLQRFITLPKRKRTEGWFANHIIRIVVISRFIPGARLPLYTACGFFKAPFLTFALSVIFATSIWTTFLFFLSSHIGGWILGHMGEWRWLGLAGLIFCIIAVGRLIARHQTMS